MTQESINDLVREAANKLSNIWGNEIIESIPNLASRYDLSTGKRIPLPERKLSNPTTLSECFINIHLPKLNEIYSQQVQTYVDKDFNELLLIGAKNANEHYLKEAENNRLRILVMHYEIHTKSEDELDLEELESEIYRCRIDQIQEQMYADFYKLVITTLSNPKPTTRQYALYYYYLQESGEYPQFPSGQKLAKCQEISKRHGISAKNFQMDYNSIFDRKNGYSERSRIPNDTKAVIKMLSDHPKAQDKARLDLDPFENR